METAYQCRMIDYCWRQACFIHRRILPLIDDVTMVVGRYVYRLPSIGVVGGAVGGICNERSRSIVGVFPIRRN